MFRSHSLARPHGIVVMRLQPGYLNYNCWIIGDTEFFKYSREIQYNFYFKFSIATEQFLFFLFYSRTVRQTPRHRGPQHLEHLALPQLGATRAQVGPRRLPGLQTQLPAEGCGGGSGGGDSARQSSGVGELRCSINRVINS